MQDHEEFTGCWFPDCGVPVPKPEAPREPLCFDHIELLARLVNTSVGSEKDAAIKGFRRRVMGLED